ncbi:hypothetical protein EPUL_000672 [Erysiphe pulchra]|uniref:Uncharacterized protein n=1 Tax=Erysiphe pulchra TaxID=225359 RepID=A0A2S4PZR5_9PEZI|nr:hypothetical protein EPUL_000672 [Erysiphe pulchra]
MAKKKKKNPIQSRLNDQVDNPNQASQNERHKQDALKKQKEGKGHWKAELASDSEEAIAADRNHRDESLHELQKRTVEHAEDKHRYVDNPDTKLF